MSGYPKIIPTAREHHVGVEIEFFNENYAHLPPLPKGYESFMRIDWENLNGCNGWEATMCAPQATYKEYLRKFLDHLITLRPHPVDGSASTGVHVHLDRRFRNPDLVDSLVQSQYAAIAQRYNKHPARTNYYNYMLYREKHNKTVELRAMEANFDFDRISHYIDDLIAMVTPADLPISNPAHQLVAVPA